MKRDKLIDTFIMLIFNEYTSFIAAKFKDKLEPVKGTHQDQPNAKFALLPGEALASMGKKEASEFFCVSVFMTNLLEEFEDYMEEHHPGAFASYESISTLIKEAVDEAERKKQEN